MSAAVAVMGAAADVNAAEPAWKPQKHVELVVGAQAGGSNDRMARLLQKVLTESGAAPAMTVVNRPGQGQTLAVAYVNSHPGDPHYWDPVSASRRSSPAPATP